MNTQQQRNSERNSERGTQLPSFQPKTERFNSFHTRNDFYRHEPKHENKKFFQQSSYNKETEAMLEKRREINKRYSFLERSPNERRGISQGIKFGLKKSN